MTQPLVSVVTPTMDPGDRLTRCLESVAMQSYVSLEHIVVDGGSTDGTLDVLKERTGLKWISEPDEGQSDAINKGFAMAQGSIIGWLNADDVLAPDAVQSVVRAFESDPEVGWIVGDIVVVGKGEAELEVPANIGKPDTWRARNLAAQPGSFMSRWALDRIGPLDPRFHYMMDFDLWLRLIDEGIKGVHIPKPLAVFEVHGDSKSGSVPHARFLVDEAAVRWKSGRHRSASFALGRAIAWADAEESDVDVQETFESLVENNPALDAKAFRAGARVETAILEMKASKTAALRLMDVRLWTTRESRSRLRSVLARGATRRARRHRASEFLAASSSLPF